MMLQDRRVCAAAAKDWVWTLNNPTAEVEEGLHRLLDLHCAYWVYGREVGQQGTLHLPKILRTKSQSSHGYGQV